MMRDDTIHREKLKLALQVIGTVLVILSIMAMPGAAHARSAPLYHVAAVKAGACLKFGFGVLAAGLVSLGVASRLE